MCLPAHASYTILWYLQRMTPQAAITVLDLTELDCMLPRFRPRPGTKVSLADLASTNTAHGANAAVPVAAHDHVSAPSPANGASAADKQAPVPAATGAALFQPAPLGGGGDIRDPPGLAQNGAANGVAPAAGQPAAAAAAAGAAGAATAAGASVVAAGQAVPNVAPKHVDLDDRVQSLQLHYTERVRLLAHQMPLDTSCQSTA